MTTGPGDQRPEGDDGTRDPGGADGGQYGGGQYGAAPYGAPEYGSPDYGAQPYGSQPYGSPDYGSPSGYGNAYPPPPPAGGYQAYPTGGNQMSGGGTPGGLAPRFGARIIDSLIIGIPMFIVQMIVGAAFGVGQALLDNTSPGIGYWVVSAIIAIVFAFAWTAYFVWFETTKGQTLGKQLLHLRVVGASGGNPTTQESLRRNGYVVLGSIGMIIGIIPIIGTIISWIIDIAMLVIVIIIAVTINSSPTKQGKHDEMAGGTRVVTTQ
ncbi:RDD family protein [Tomitella gaofuii]|uniref:RDD family protein n=1 Tax=Tomitella gaofuii TaxID=2760083 RepID=UPI0022A88364|nr:RDD family protein [Tomitella gaofuii]